MNEIARTILGQFGGSRALAMIGGNCVYGPTHIMIAFKAKAKNKSNKVIIKLDPDDTYTVEFWRIRGINANKLESFPGVYGEDLQPLFERRTGLYLHF